MTLTGYVKNGAIVVEKSVPFPEGARVRIEWVEAEEEPHSGVPFRERYASVIGKAVGLPADASLNVDHYLYGAPKR
jgi:hypothetical protein